MSEERLDCRGLACPGPVLKTKELLDRGGVQRITVLVDNGAAGENVSRFLGRFGYRVEVSEGDGAFTVIGSRDEAPACEVFVPEEHSEEAKLLVLIGTRCMGTGDDVLGEKLMENFVGTLKEMGPALWRVVLVNGGVKLAVEGSPCLEPLRELERNGVHLMVCGTCLNHFGLLEKKQVGDTTNMLDIVTSLQLADRVVSLT